MCLNGSLDDFSIQDILQVLSLSRKTGSLSLETPSGGAAVIFQEGCILASVDDGGPPRAWMAPEVMTPGADRATTGSLAGPGGELSVLLVDDEELVRRLLARYLVAGGYPVKRLARLRLRPPVVMMADCASVSTRVVPMRGVWSVVLKPGLSKLDPEEFEADLRALAGRMVQEVLPRVCSALSAWDESPLPLATEGGRHTSAASSART